MTHKILRTWTSLLLAIAFSLAGFHPALASAPTNDNFADAVTVSLPFSAAVDISEAGIEANEPQACSFNERTVWYAFTPSEGMTLRLDIQGSSIPALVGVYRSQSDQITGLDSQQCGDFYSNPVSNVPMEAGFTYYFQVGAISGAGGEVQVNLEQITPPANNNFADAEAITSLSFHGILDNRGASREVDEPADCYGPRYTVWYSFTVPADATIRVNMDGSSFSDTQFAFYRPTGSGLTGLSFVNCGYFGIPITFNVQAGDVFYIQAGAIFSEGGELHLNIEPLLPPANDNFAAAIDAAGLPFSASFDNGGATFETDEPTTCGYPAPPYKTIWYRYTAAQAGSVSAHLESLTFSGYIAAYSGTSMSNLVNLGCAGYTERTTFRATAGQTYYFQVGGIYTEGGSGSFVLETAPAPQAGINFSPGNPSKFDNIQFCSSSYDPGNVGIESFAWDFGDGTTGTEGCSLHRYAADGDYTVQHTVTTFDGRSASTSQVVQVRTHDVSIASISAPKSANSGQTKTITVAIRNSLYAESSVRVDLYKSMPGGNVYIGSLTLPVPVSRGNRTTQFSINYTFTAEDAQVGKVAFRAEAFIEGWNDAFPQDNVVISSPPTRVGR